jgi:hypothetical protein
MLYRGRKCKRMQSLQITITGKALAIAYQKNLMMMIYKDKVIHTERGRKQTNMLFISL